MASIQLDIPDAALPRVVAALCARGHYTAAEGPKGAFAKKVLAQWLREEVQRYEQVEADKAALAAVVPPSTVDIS